MVRVKMIYWSYKKNLFGSGQAAPKSGTSVRNEDGSLGMGGQEEVCGVLGECPENE